MLTMRRLGIALVSVWLITSGCGTGSTEPRASDAGPSRADAGRNADAGADSCPKTPSSAAAGTRRLEVNEQPPAPDGIFDLSVDYPAGARTGFVAYSSVEGKLVHTRVAESDDRGASFDYRSNVNTATPTTIETSDLSVCGASQCSGHWVHETPSLVIDASDPDSQRLFKVFVHTYFVDEAQDLHYTIGNLGMFTGPGPLGPWTEHRLIGWSSSSPSSSTGVGQHLSTDSELSGASSCIVLTEPGALVAPMADGSAALHLAVGCVRLVSETEFPIEIKLLRSRDHGLTWSFVSTLLDAADAAAFGAPKRQLNAAAFYRVDGRVYLFATPDGPVNLAGTIVDGYRGCLGFEVKDLEAGSLTRCDGRPVIRSSILGKSQQFLGACSYAEGASALGVAMDILDLSTTPTFKIFSNSKAP